jgi:hypothetical protein
MCPSNMMMPLMCLAQVDMATQINSSSQLWSTPPGDARYQALTAVMNEAINNSCTNVTIRVRCWHVSVLTRMLSAFNCCRLSQPIRIMTKSK